MHLAALCCSKVRSSGFLVGAQGVMTLAVAIGVNMASFRSLVPFSLEITHGMSGSRASLKTPLTATRVA
jgi:hypothetical protein